MAGLIPAICQRHADVRVIVGGDGPKRILLEEMREKCNLQDRVEMLGQVNHDEVAQQLGRGHIYLNTSLTEAFCMAIVEAASCGLLVVSTRVGGVPEVLPDDMIMLAEPELETMLVQLERAVLYVRDGRLRPSEVHERISKAYTWDRVAARTEIVYEFCLASPTSVASHHIAGAARDRTIPYRSHLRLARSDRIRRHLRCYRKFSVIWRFVFSLIALFDYFLLGLLDWLLEPMAIDKAPELPFISEADGIPGSTS